MSKTRYYEPSVNRSRNKEARTVSVKLCVLGLVLSLHGIAASGAVEIEFNRDIRPILSNRCFACHGPDPASRKAELRLDAEAAAKADRGGYAAIVPGKSSESELIRRVASDDA